MAKCNRMLLYSCVVTFYFLYPVINSQDLVLSTTIPVPNDIGNGSDTLSISGTTVASNLTSAVTPSTPPVASTTSPVSSTSNSITNSGSLLGSSTSLSISEVTTSTTISFSVSTSQTTTSPFEVAGSPKAPPGPGWWLLVGLVITIIIVIITGVIFHYRQKSPYRRFLRNWRSREDDTDNIILQLEQPEITNNHWPPRISFS